MINFKGSHFPKAVILLLPFLISFSSICLSAEDEEDLKALQHAPYTEMAILEYGWYEDERLIPINGCVA